MVMPRGPRKDLVGKKFGRWTVLTFAGFGNKENLSKYAMWLCACKCGTMREVIGRNLMFRLTESCGCASVERNIQRTKHGMTDSPEYNAWSSMWARVRGTEGAARDRHRYAGRGITCCDRWKLFENFYKDMGPRPNGYTLDRKDNDKGYFPNNCRWATKRQQARNKGNNRIVTAFGISMTLADWADRTGINYFVLWARIVPLGWTPEKALTTSVERKTIPWQST